MSDQVGKSALLTIGIGLISTGAINLQSGELITGIILVAMGLTLIAVYTFLVEKQASEAAVKRIVEIAEKNELQPKKEKE